MLATPNRHAPRPLDLTAEEHQAWDDWYKEFGCQSCGGYLHEAEGRALLYPNGQGGDLAWWVKACDCPAPYHTSTCEVHPF